jgi:hypothetical protein
MKFFSKQGNLRVVLKHGMPAEPLTGRNAIPGLYVRFENGVANVASEESIILLKNHPRFNYDFVSEETKQSDPFLNTRADNEPRHIITEMKYGTAAGTTISPKNVQISPELQSLINKKALEIAKNMVVDILSAQANAEGSGAPEATPVVDEATEPVAEVKKTVPKKPRIKKTV